MTSSRDLWYLTRGSGVVALVLLTAVVVVGMLTSLRVAGRGWPRFAIGGVHRNLTLLSIVFVAAHVVTTVADGYAPIGLKDAVVPFASPYRAVWLGLGAVAFDLVLALVVTSYLRHRIGVRAWRSLHWLAYAAWPVALVHGLGTGSDARTSWLTIVAGASLAAVALAALARVAAAGGAPIVRAAAAGAALLVPVAIGAWYLQGPAARGWAARAGTPRRLLASQRRLAAHPILASSVAPAPSPPRAFTSAVAGTVSQSQFDDGSVDVALVLRLRGGPHGALRIDLRGRPAAGGVAMAASGVSFVPATTRAVYLGAVTALNDSAVAATVKDAAGDTLDLTAALALDSRAGTVSGTVRGVTPGSGSTG